MSNRWQRLGRRLPGNPFVVLPIILVIFGGVSALGWLFPRQEPPQLSQCQPYSIDEKHYAAESWVKQVGGECIGFSDGSYKFQTADPDLASLLDDIHSANENLAGNNVYTVVVAVPIAGSSNSNKLLGRAGINELRGAYLAQRAINAAAAADSWSVGVRLLVANIGWQSGASHRVAERIDEAAKKDPRLVGVLGFFQSVPSAEAAVALLDDSTHIPIVSSVASDDKLTRVDENGTVKRPHPWYFRVGPTNSREARAIVQALRSIARELRPLIVTDHSDPFSSNLASDIQIRLSGDLSVNASLGTIDDVAKRCEADTPNIVIYTGRAVDLHKFVGTLNQSACVHDIPIISGDDAMEIQGNIGPAGTHGMMPHPFYFADFGSQPGEPQPYPTDRIPRWWQEQIQDAASNASLQSGHVMLAFDATAIFASGLQDALQRIKPGEEGKLRETIRAVLDGYCGRNAVPAASGLIDFDQYGDIPTKQVIIRKLDEGSFPRQPGSLDGPTTRPSEGCGK